MYNKIIGEDKMEKIAIKMLNLKEENVELIKDDIYKENPVIYVRLKNNECACPNCRYKAKHKVQKYTKRYIKFINDMKYKYILYDQRSLYCKKCKHTFIEHNNIVNKYCKHSIITEKIVDNKLASMDVSFSQIAIATGTKKDYVISRFDKIKLSNTNKTLPVVLSIDEFCFQRTLPKYDLFLLDTLNNKIHTIMRDRRKFNLEKYFASFPLKERLKVKIVSMDLWKPYKDLVKKYFPNALIVADKFHFSRYMSLALMQLRIDNFNRVVDYVLKRTLKRNWKSIQKPLNKESTKFHKNLIKRLLNHPDLDDAFKSMIRVFNEFYSGIKNEMTRQEAEQFIDEIIYQLQCINHKAVKDIITAYTNWKEEIINALVLRDKNGKSYTNGRIEGINNLIKKIKRQSYGFRRHDRFVKKIILAYNYKHGENFVIV